MKALAEMWGFFVLKIFALKINTLKNNLIKVLRNTKVCVFLNNKSEQHHDNHNC